MEFTIAFAKFRLRLFLSLFLFVGLVNAQDDIDQEPLFTCMEEELKTASTETTTGELRDRCRTQIGNSQISNSIDERVVYEKQASSNPFAILPHKPNYLLPTQNLRKDLTVIFCKERRLMILK